MILRLSLKVSFVARLSRNTIWHWRHQGVIRRWRHGSWIFPRNPEVAVKAGRILDSFARTRKGAKLRGDDFLISVEKKTGIGRAAAKHQTLPTQPRPPVCVRHEYKRSGASVSRKAVSSLNPTRIR